MTSYEHAMLGINGALAAGLPRKYGWQIVALAGVASAAPDWDGLTILVSVELFNESHRVWGHNLLACVLLGIGIGWVDYRCDLVTRSALRLQQLGLRFQQPTLTPRTHWQASTQATWMLVGVLAALSQLPADLVVSGTRNLPDWELQLFWPFSDRGWVLAMVSWGDPAITLLFVAGMFALLRWPHRYQRVASVTLAAVVLYIAVRGALR